MGLDKPKVKIADMSEDMIEFAMNTALQGFEQNVKEVDVASFIRSEFDRTYGLTWNCVIGRNYGSDVTHESKRYISFQVGQLSVLLWKSN